MKSERGIPGSSRLESTLFRGPRPEKVAPTGQPPDGSAVVFAALAPWREIFWETVDDARDSVFDQNNIEVDE